MSIDVLGEDSGENVQNSDYDRVIVSDRDEHVAQRLTLDDYRRILRELDQNRDLQNRRREKLSQVSQRRLRKKRTSDANQETSTRSSSCYLCNIRVALEDITTFAICRGCDQTVCRARRCSDWDRGTGYWECVSCIRSRDSQIRAGEWILDQLNQRFKNPRSDTSRDDLSFKDAETQSNGSFLGSTHSISLEQKDKVREFLEDVIASMIGGSLDDVPVNQTHKHPSYLPLPENECPGVAHVNLKRLIQKVIEEALNLPDLFNYSGYPQRPDSHLPYFSSKRYEQLLATAVLNKVIDHYRNPKNHQENSSGIQSGSEFDSNHNALSDKAAILSPTGSQKALDKHLEEASQMSESSLKTRSTESDETYLSDYIQKHRVPLPDLSAASSEGTVDDTASEMTAGTEGTWEENWLFKKRKVKSDTNSTAIGMLVPSPTEEVKAFIGDKNVDEVSDLSEAGSDVEDDPEERPAAKLIESKTIIGGKNELISLEDSSSATDSLLSNPDSGINVTEARNEVLLIDGEFVDGPHSTDPPQAINENIQTFLNGTEIPVPTPRQSTVEKAEKLQLLDENLVSKVPEIQSDTPEPDSLEDEHLIPGSIAEREHLKWQHPDADIPNNPYSPEALQQRLVGKGYNGQSSTTSTPSNVESPQKTPERSLQVVLGEGSPDHKRYGRDYYINDAKRSSGTRKKHPDDTSRTSDEDKVSALNENPCLQFDTGHVPTNMSSNYDTNSSYILNKFLAGTGGDFDFGRNTKLRRSVSLKSFRARNTLDDAEVHSVGRRRGMQTFRPTAKEVATFEAKLLHNDLRRNSFRAAKGTSNFVLNPIFDDPTEDEEINALQRLKSASSVSVLNVRDSDTESDASWRFYAAERSECIETVFDDLSSLRRRTRDQKKSQKISQD